MIETVQRWLTEHPQVAWIGLLGVLALLLMGGDLIPPEGQVVGAQDMRGEYMMYYKLQHEGLGAGQLTLWDSDTFSGISHVANSQTWQFYPFAQPFLWLMKPNVAASWLWAMNMWICGIGMLLFTRRMGASWLGAGLAAITWAFSGFVIARMMEGHITIPATIGYTPWLMWSSLWAIEKKSIPAGLLAGVPLGLAFLAGHVTSLLFIALMWGAFLVYLLVRGEPFWIVVQQAALASVVGLLLGAVLLIPVFEFTQLSTRSVGADYDFASRFSFPPAHLITLLIPDFFGEPVQTGYWSVPNFVELTYYAGVLPLLMLPLALRRPSTQTWFWLIFAVFGLLMALGTYGFLHRLLWDIFPPYRLNRGPGRAMILYTLAASALLADTVTRLQAMSIEERRDLLNTVLRVTLIVIGVGAVAALAATGAVFASVHPTDTSGRLWHQLGGWGKAATLLLGGGGLLWMLLGSDDRRRQMWAGAGLVLLVTADLWLLGARLIEPGYIIYDPAWPQADAMIGDDLDGRVIPWGLSEFSQDFAIEYDLPSVFGYRSLKLYQYEAFTAAVPDPRARTFDILSAEYVISYDPRDDLLGDGRLELVGNDERAWVYRRTTALPLVRVVHDYEVIPDPGEAVARLLAADFDPARIVILSQEPACEVTPAEDSTAAIVTHDPEHWEIATSSDAPGLLVVSESAYPGWQAAVDGEPVEALTAYTVVRASCLPAGDHLVTWEFKPGSVRVGAALSALGLVIVAISFWRLPVSD